MSEAIDLKHFAEKYPYDIEGRNRRMAKEREQVGVTEEEVAKWPVPQSEAEIDEARLNHRLYNGISIGEVVERFHVEMNRVAGVLGTLSAGFDGMLTRAIKDGQMQQAYAINQRINQIDTAVHLFCELTAWHPALHDYNDTRTDMKTLFANEDIVRKWAALVEEGLKSVGYPVTAEELFEEWYRPDEEETSPVGGIEELGKMLSQMFGAEVEFEMVDELPTFPGDPDKSALN